jgi:hypothetical protein
MKKSMDVDAHPDIPLFTRQLKMEQQSYLVAMEKLYMQSDAIKRAPSLGNSELRHVVSVWFEKLDANLATELKSMNDKSKGSCNDNNVLQKC